MSKEVYSIDNQKAFNLGMIVGKFFMEKYFDTTSNWAASEECLDIVYEIWKRTNGDGTIQAVEKSLDDVMQLDVSLLEVGDKRDVTKYTEEENNLSQDLYFGFISGEHLGLPSKENLEKANKAMEIFMNNLRYGFLQDVYMTMQFIFE